MNIYILAETTESIGERALTALKDSALGMVVVFAALIILWGAVELLHVCVAAATKKKAARVQDAPAEDTSAAPDAATQSAQDDAAIVAAITAAIALVTEEPVGSFRVVSFKRADAGSAWNKK